MWVSQTVCSSYLSHIVVTTHCLPRPTCLPLQRRVGSMDRLVSRDWPGSILLMFWLPICRSSTKGSTVIPAPPSQWSRKPADIRQHDSMLCPHLLHEPRLANCSYAWSQRLCGITLTIHELGWHLWKLRIQSLSLFFSLCLVVLLWSTAAVLLSTQNWYFCIIITITISHDKCWRHYSVTSPYIVHWYTTLQSRLTHTGRYWDMLYGVFV